MRTRILTISLACATALASWSWLSSGAVSWTSQDGALKALRGWKTNTAKRSIELSELISGGPPKDGIPALNNPAFVSTGDARKWLKPREPVISLVLGEEARAYPLQVLIWHEVVNDFVARIPVAVTFCPLCYSAVVFDRRLGDRELVFGVTGLLRHSDMVMYDRETESLWQQLTGDAIVGDLTGTKLKQLPAQIISFEQFASAHTDGLVLSRETGFKREYGRNPYAGYDDIAERPFLYRGRLDHRLPPMEKVVAVSTDGVDKAYPHSLTRKLRVINDRLVDRTIVIFHDKGAVSALDDEVISWSREAGSTGVFDARIEGQTLSFRYIDGKFMDHETGSIWDVTGAAIEGRLKGRRLSPIAHGDFFAFVWLAFKPDTKIYQSK